MAEANVMREYMTQLRTELGLRLLDKVYEDDQSQPSKVSSYKLFTEYREVMKFNSSSVFSLFSGGFAFPSANSSIKASPPRDIKEKIFHCSFPTSLRSQTLITFTNHCVPNHRFF